MTTLDLCTLPTLSYVLYLDAPLRLCLYRGTILYFFNLVRMISVIDGSPRGYDFAITVKRFENTGQCPEIIPPYQEDTGFGGGRGEIIGGNQMCTMRNEK